ncbi:MAG: phosphatase PAP2 family protein [Promethearchaeota archaeon]
MWDKLKISGTTKLLLIIFLIGLILTAIFGFTDLEISKAVVDEDSLWGIFGSKFGEAPGYGLIAIGLAALIGSYNKDVKKQKIPAYVIIVIGISLLVLGITFSSQALMIDGAAITLTLIVFVIITFNKDWKSYRGISALITFLAIINPLLFVQITKILCGRIRFRDLSPGFTEYTPWFLPPGPSSNGRSFPSGHAAVAWMFLPLLIIVKDKKWNDNYKIILGILVIGWGLFVCLSRVVLGAHYASDVLFSTLIAIITTLILYKKLYK